MFQGLSNLGSLMRGAQELSGKLQGLGEELKNRRATGSAGGGMVEVEVNGALDVLRCTIDPKLIAGGDREMIEDLVMAAANDAIARGRALHAEAMRDLTGGLNLPGLQDALAKISGGPAHDA